MYFELGGKYNTAKVFTDIVDNESISQVIELLNQPYVAGETVRMMPDIHAGSGCTIGTTLTIKDKVCPNLVGADIGCGMEVVRIAEKDLDLEKLDKVIREYIPCGFETRKSIFSNSKMNENDLQQLHCADAIDVYSICKSLGTLGGGNHFIGATRS